MMPPPPGSIRIATYNTRDFLDDRYAAARVVRAIAPDVLCLQEVPRRWWSGPRVAGFADLCGMTWPGRHRGSGGTTIFVAPESELLAASHQRLHVATAKRTRGFACARLQLRGAPALTIASIHLSLSSVERVAHARTVLAGMHALAGSEQMVVAGDLNETSEGLAWSLFERVLRPVGPTDPTYPARRPKVRIDAIFASRGLFVVRGEDRADPVVDERDVAAASDHLPVWVDLAFAHDPAARVSSHHPGRAPDPKA